MSRSTLSAILAVAAASTLVFAQPDPADPIPLVNKHYAYPSGIPYQVDYNTAAIRGPQTGYNICNSTTQNQESECQTSFVNHIDDFCLWAPAAPNSTIADTEGQEVAWCTKSGHGTRVIPEGALQAVQYLRTPDYIQITGYFDQTQVNMAAGDYGGELDPHGADLRGNPLGGLMYSNAYPSNNTDNSTYTQITDWTNFMGGNAFCIKVCDPTGSNQQGYCQNIYDRLGCSYNAPSNVVNGTFEACDADDMTPVGVYVTNGATMTYTQPAESLGAITTVPYTPVVPSSSNCVQYQSAQLYSGAPAPTSASSVPTSLPSGGAGGAGGSNSGNGSPSGSASRSGSAAGAGTTGTSNGANTLGVSAVASVVGVVFAMAFLS